MLGLLSGHHMKTQGRLAEASFFAKAMKDARLTLGCNPQPLWGCGDAEWSGERWRLCAESFLRCEAMVIGGCKANEALP